MEAYQSENYRGFEIEIHLDECPQNPRKFYDHLGTLAWVSDRRHIRGDEGHEHEDRVIMLEAIADLSYEQGEWYDNKRYNDYHFNEEAYLLNQIAKDYIFYDEDDQFCYVSKDAIRKEWNVKRISSKLHKQIVSNMKSEINEFNAWANGYVFGFQIKDESDELLDSCWGFYGESEIPYMVSECKSIIDNRIAERKADHFKRLKAKIRAKVALLYREAYQYAI